MEHIMHDTNGKGDDGGDYTTQYEHFVQSCKLYTLYTLQYTMVWYRIDQGLLE